MATFSAVPCYEEHASFSDNISLDKWDTTATLRCDWNNRYALAGDLLLNQRVHPYVSDGPRAFTCGIRPFPAAATAQLGQGMSYEDALVTVSYSMESKDLVSESLEPSAEFIKLDYKQFRWGSANGDPLLEGEAPGRLLRGLNLVRTLYFVESPLPVSLLTLTGHVNAAAYYSAFLNLTFDKETLLYTPPVLTRTISTSEIEAWTITLKFMYKPEGWNKFWRAKSQAYSTIYIANGGKYESYPLGNFAPLLF